MTFAEQGGTGLIFYVAQPMNKKAINIEAITIR
jgi:hypothetical protein